MTHFGDATYQKYFFWAAHGVQLDIGVTPPMLASWEPTPFVLCGPTSLALYIEWLEQSLTSHPEPNSNQPEIEWSPLPTLQATEFVMR